MKHGITVGGLAENLLASVIGGAVVFVYHLSVISAHGAPENADEVLYTEALVDTLKQQEGWQATPYEDTEGVLTIGYGTNLSEGITEAEGEYLLRSRLTALVLEFAHEWTPFILLPEGTRDALADMVYELGLAGVLEFHDMLYAISQGHCGDAKAAALDSEWARQVPNRAQDVAARLC